MCSGCGKIPRPSIKVPKIYQRPTKEAIAALESERRTCPSCHRKMAIQPGGTLVCKPCGVSRR